jgi:hypothetical protein
MWKNFRYTMTPPWRQTMGRLRSAAEGVNGTRMSGARPHAPWIGLLDITVGGTALITLAVADREFSSLAWGLGWGAAAVGSALFLVLLAGPSLQRSWASL